MKKELLTLYLYFFFFGFCVLDFASEIGYYGQVHKLIIDIGGIKFLPIFLFYLYKETR